MISGRVWRFGDGIDTDVLAPGIYMKKPLAELARHCLEAVDPAFAANVQPGDIVVAGRNFGLGSSREQAAQALTELGVGAVIAQSFARIFYRNALNLGLPALFCDEVAQIEAGHRLTVDPVAGTILNETSGARLACRPIPAHLMEMVGAGGLMPYLKRRFAKESA
jgi:3-isopropylmalate/(R)-2-methylmalate dehydratase small subunit